MIPRIQPPWLRSIARQVLLAVLVALPGVLVTTAQAALVISPTGPTTNVTCLHHVCTATASSAVLNRKTLQNQLAVANVKVVSGSLANDIVVSATVTWVSSHTLTLDSYHSIAIGKPVSVAGSGGLTLTTNDGGTGGQLSFVATTSNITFWSLASGLTINGHPYTLVNDIATLASDIAATPGGYYALAKSYDATPDGTYAASPIPTTYVGAFEGLGNTISHLTINSTDLDLGLFKKLGAGGTLRDIGVPEASVTNVPRLYSFIAYVGTLVGFSDGTIFGAFGSGTVTTGKDPWAGGLVGAINSGSISNSFAATNVSIGISVEAITAAGGLVGVNSGVINNCRANGNVVGGSGTMLGGLVGENLAGIVSASYARGSVASLPHGQREGEGGLVGVNNNGATIINSYATGAVQSIRKSGSSTGGLVGFTNGVVENSYSIGAVEPGGTYVGGSIGDDESASGSVVDSYWDTSTSGITNLSRGAGNVSNDPGITGLTTAQLQSALPTGFDPSIWGESTTVNGGLPYLLAMPLP
jgi:hypothetical protein